MKKTGTISELWDFLMQRKKWWLTPIVLILLLTGMLFIFCQSSAVVPFIYALF